MIDYFWPLVFTVSYFVAIGLIWAFIHGAKVLSDGINRAKPDHKKLYRYWGLK